MVCVGWGLEGEAEVGEGGGGVDWGARWGGLRCRVGICGGNGRWAGEALRCFGEERLRRRESQNFLH